MKLSESIKNLVISDVETFDVRFPTSLTLLGSDAVHVSPDYSCAYVILSVKGSNIKGNGLTFTIGRGTDIVVHAVNEYAHLLRGRKLEDIYSNFGKFWSELTNEHQLRWLGPEKGVVHLAVAAIVNALWDLWGKLENKPVWKLIADMTPEEFVSLIDFRHITDVLKPAEALEIVRSCEREKVSRRNAIETSGVPAYVTSAGWMGYDDQKIERLCKEALDAGWDNFKMKVGLNVADDQRRARIIRKIIGPERKLMMDANQIWEVDEAIHWMHQLAEFNPHWIEEPTSPDDIRGHKKISDTLAPLGIGVATGEHCQNRVMFKQFLVSGAMQYCQIDSCRLGGLNENLAVMLMAAKYNIPVCPHAGGVGLCGYVQHLSIINYLCIKPSFANTMVEYADSCNHHFVHPSKILNGRYIAPQDSGYSAELKEDSLRDHIYPTGKVWQELIAAKKHIPK